MNINYPKNANASLIKKVNDSLNKINNGLLKARKTNRKGYLSYALGRYERLVVVGDVWHCFSKHSDYERFINN